MWWADFQHAQETCLSLTVVLKLTNVLIASQPFCSSRLPSNPGGISYHHRAQLLRRQLNRHKQLNNLREHKLATSPILYAVEYRPEQPDCTRTLFNPIGPRDYKYESQSSEPAVKIQRESCVVKKNNSDSRKLFNFSKQDVD